MTSILRILIINYEYPPLGGGGGIATAVFARELSKLGHNVTVLTTHFKGLKFRETQGNITIYRVPVLFRTQKSKASILSLLTWPFLSIPAALYLCSRKHFDVINTHFILPTGITGLIASAVYKIPNALYVHGADIYDPQRLEMTPSGSGIFAKLLRETSKLVLKHAQRIVCQSHDTASRVLELFPFTKPRLNILPLPFEKPDFEIKHNKPNYNQLKLISIGRLVKRKGYNFLLEALSLLPQYMNVELDIIGEGPEKNNLITLAKNLDLLDRVRFKGFVSEQEKYTLLTQADVYILSSLHEGMGIVIQEAMYAGLPIVSTNVGGQNDLLEQNVNALMVNPQDAEMLKKAIIEIYENKPLRTTLSINNIQKIQLFYSDKIGYAFAQYLETLTEKYATKTS